MTLASLVLVLAFMPLPSSAAPASCTVQFESTSTGAGKTCAFAYKGGNVRMTSFGYGIGVPTNVPNFFVVDVQFIFNRVYYCSGYGPGVAACTKNIKPNVPKGTVLKCIGGFSLYSNQRVRSFVRFSCANS